jgi:hypothetical protein
VRPDVCLGQDPAGLAGGDRDLMLSGQVRGDAGVGPRRLGACGLAGGGGDDQQPCVDVVDQGTAGAGPVFHRAHALGQVAAAGGPDGVGVAAQLAGDLRVRDPGRGQQHDPRPPDLALRRGLRAGDPLEFPAPPPGKADDVLAGSARHSGPPGMTVIMRDRQRMPSFADPSGKARRYATPGTMPVPPRKLKDQVEDNLDHYASQRWPQLEEVTIRWHGSYGYLTAYITEDDVPLCRIAYLGSPGDWGFAIYQAGTETYQESILPDGSPAGTPQQALDCACGLYLADPSAWI